MRCQRRPVRLPDWENAEHIAELAHTWNVKTNQIPHYGPPTPAMQIFRYAEQGSIKQLWISGTNPAVSLPELARIRNILTQDRLQVIVQELFLTETARLADIVLPAATWGEKTGVFTNADRTVHLSDKAVEPPGDARPDLEIFLDYAARMDFRDKDRQPLVWWHDAETAFEAWKRASAGRPCDYTGLTHAKLRGRSGIQWPCTDERPEGTERLYTDGRFFAHPDTAETYGKDLATGASVSVVEYRSLNPDGKAMLKAAEYLPPHELPSEQCPFQLTTGRTIYHFHTRTKTGRAAELNNAAPEVWVEMSTADSTAFGIDEGDLVEVRTARGRVDDRARISGIRAGMVFLPFHYGYWDTTGADPGDGPGRAANELTPTDWDPVSKQPLFKTAAASVHRVEGESGVSPAPLLGGSASAALTTSYSGLDLEPANDPSERTVHA